jgi:hypothetical protein
MQRNKNAGRLMMMIVAGVLIGSLIGTILSQFVPFLMYGPGPLGIRDFRIDLGIIQFQLSFLIDLNLAGLIGLILAAFLFKKM